MKYHLNWVMCNKCVNLNQVDTQKGMFILNQERVQGKKAKKKENASPNHAAFHELLCLHTRQP